MKKNRTYGLMAKVGLLKMIKRMRFTIFIVFVSLSQTIAVNSLSINGSKPEIEQESVNQPQKALSGKVVDSSGAPLTGVTVVIKGTTTGIITDSDGNYSLSNVPPAATLVFSFVGMKTQEVAITGKTTINVTLDNDAVGIEEVVAIGYGVQKRANVVGAVTSLSGEE